MRKRLYYVSVILFAMVLALLLSDCATKKYSIESEPLSAEARASYNIKMDLTYLKKDTLIERFGTKNNPFIKPPALFSKKKEFLVFEVHTVNNTPPSERNSHAVVMSLKTIIIVYQGRILSPTSRVHLTEYWESLVDSADVRGQYVDRMKHTIRKWVFPSVVEIESGSEFTGILVFIGKFPQIGDATIEIPIFTKNSKLIGIFHEDIAL